MSLVMVRGQIMEEVVGHYKDFDFYCEWKMNLLESFEMIRSDLYLKWLILHVENWQDARKNMENMKSESIVEYQVEMAVV